jgi:hypothetical protein
MFVAVLMGWKLYSTIEDVGSRVIGGKLMIS